MNISSFFFIAAHFCIYEYLSWFLLPASTISFKVPSLPSFAVMTAKRASDALCIIREREDEVDLVLSDACLPDMTRYELLERVGRMSKLPVVSK